MQISSRHRSDLSERVTTYTVTGHHCTRPPRSDRVTISPEARELHAALERELEAEERESDVDTLDGVSAGERARAYAYSLDRARLDRTDEIAGSGPARYASTRVPVTRESELRFNLLAREIRTRRIAIYEAEHAAGTDPNAIITKLVTFMEAQPPDYRAMLDWDRLQSHLGHSHGAELDAELP